MGVGETLPHHTRRVFFGPPAEQAGKPRTDPYFPGGAGPARQACRHCGECMTGCRHGAKNTLLTNYLHLAERAGAVVVPLTTVRSLEPKPGGGWLVGTERTATFGAAGASAGRGPRHLDCRANRARCWRPLPLTQKLLQTMVLEGKLPELSPRLGELTRTNSESLLGATVARGRPHPDFSRGVAITSSFYPEPGTHAEPVRYGHGSNMMGLFGTMLVKGRARRSRCRRGWSRPARAGNPLAQRRLLVSDPAPDAAVARLARVVGTHGDCPRHAVSRQLPYRICKKGPPRAPLDEPAGPWSAKPSLVADRP